jgi:hypothetical protein
MPDLSELIKAIDRQTYVLSVIAKELCLLVQNNVGAKVVSGSLIDEMEATLGKEANHGSS